MTTREIRLGIIITVTEGKYKDWKGVIYAYNHMLKRAKVVMFRDNEGKYVKEITTKQTQIKINYKFLKKL